MVTGDNSNLRNTATAYLLISIRIFPLSICVYRFIFALIRPLIPPTPSPPLWYIVLNVFWFVWFGIHIDLLMPEYLWDCAFRRIDDYFVYCGEYLSSWSDSPPIHTLVVYIAIHCAFFVSSAVCLARAHNIMLCRQLRQSIWLAWCQTNRCFVLNFISFARFHSLPFVRSFIIIFLVAVSGRNVRVQY